MKKVLTILALAALSTTLAPVPAHAAPDGSGIYSQTAAVISLDYESDLVTVQTAGGMVYAFYGCEDYFESDLVSLVMWGNNTPADVTDDMILSARYSGYALDDLAR